MGLNEKEIIDYVEHQEKEDNGAINIYYVQLNDKEIRRAL